jgi:hypothetical protein
LAHADRNGDVDIHPRAIADEVGLPEPDVRAALLCLESTDAESRTPTEDGRRIIRMDAHRAWGWRIVNHAKYRAIRSEEDRREQNRLAQERWRDKQNKPASATISPASCESAHTDTDTDTEAETKAETKKKKGTATAAPWLTAEFLVQEGLTAETAAAFIDHRRTKKAKLTALAWKGFKSEVEKATGWTLEAAAMKAIARSWISVEAAWLLSSSTQGASGAPINRQKALEDRGRAVSAEWAAKMAAKNAGGGGHASE